MKEVIEPKSNVAAVLLMGGLGTRFGSETPKQFHRLAGKKIYLMTLEHFIEAGFFSQIYLVCPRNWEQEVERDIAIYQHSALKVISGGITRQASSFAGLKACHPATDFVMIHDCVRPFIQVELLRRHLESVKEHHAVDTCIASSDTIVHSQDGNWIHDIPARYQYLRGQTPQSFKYDWIFSAHQKALQDHVLNATDDCGLLLRTGKKIFILEGSEHNIKITNELDLTIAEHLLRLKQTSAADLQSEPVSLQGKKYVVTGGSGGIGQAICRLLEAEGACPIVISRNSKDYKADLTDASHTEKVFQLIFGRYGAVDGLINSAGLFKLKEFEKMHFSEIEEMIAANLTSLIFCCKSAKIKPGGHIVNIASSSYSKGRKEIAVYSSSKAAVVNFTQGLAEEFAGLHVNVIVPPRTNTAMRRQFFPHEPPHLLLPPEKVAQAVIDVLKQSGLTGTIIETRLSSKSRITE